MNTHTYYESPDYECEGQPGLFAGIRIIGDDDGPRLLFSSDAEIILDLPIPLCEALDMRKGLGEAMKDAITAAERLTDLPERLTGIWEPDSNSLPPAEPPAALPPQHQHVQHPPAIPPPAAMTPYGRREIGPEEYPPGGWPRVGYPSPDLPAAAVERGPEAPGEPPINHTRPLPVCHPGSRLLRRTG